MGYLGVLIILLLNRVLLFILGLCGRIWCIAGTAWLLRFHVCVCNGGNKRPPRWYTKKGWLVLMLKLEPKFDFLSKWWLCTLKNELYLPLETICYIMPIWCFRIVMVCDGGIWQYSFCTWVVYNYFIVKLFKTFSKHNFWTH